jgi:hypothetical protein
MRTVPDLSPAHFTSDSVLLVQRDQLTVEHCPAPVQLTAPTVPMAIC